MSSAAGSLPALTVVIPTHNAPARVEACVRALLGRLDESSLAADILVVDNGSRADDAAQVAALGTLDDRVRVITEPRQGATLARNLGLANARPPLVAFVDHDVLVEPGWLDAIAAPFADDDVVGVVGQVVLAPELPLPGWLTHDLEGWYSALDLGDQGHPLAADEYGWTSNLAVRRAAALAIGGFNESFGPGQRAGYNDDLDFLDRLRPHGTLWYAADARALHCVGRERLTRRWLLQRAFLQGRSNAALVRANGATAPASWATTSGRAFDALARRWGRTLRRCRPPTTRQRALLDDGMRRLEALGSVLEDSRAAISRRVH